LAGGYFADAFVLFAVVVGAVEHVFHFEVEGLSGVAEAVVQEKLELEAFPGDGVAGLGEEAKCVAGACMVG